VETGFVLVTGGGRTRRGSGGFAVRCQACLGEEWLDEAMLRQAPRLDPLHPETLAAWIIEQIAPAHHCPAAPSPTGSMEQRSGTTELHLPDELRDYLYYPIQEWVVSHNLRIDSVPPVDLTDRRPGVRARSFWGALLLSLPIFTHAYAMCLGCYIVWFDGSPHHPSPTCQHARIRSAAMAYGDAGVLSRAQVPIARTSLELGPDNPTVGDWLVRMLSANPHWEHVLEFSHSFSGLDSVREMTMHERFEVFPSATCHLCDGVGYIRPDADTSASDDDEPP